MGLILVFIYATFLDYLTNWALVSCAFLYTLMAIAHCVNGDFKKDEYVATPTDQRKNCAYSMWRMITCLYEWTLSVQFCVILAFWLVEIPAMGRRGDFYRFRLVDWITLTYTHTIPFLICFAEWKVSAIPIGWTRYPFYVLSGMIYVVVLILRDRAEEKRIYASFDWKEKIGHSSIMACVVLAQQLFAFGMLKLFSDRKLRVNVETEDSNLVRK